MKLRTDIADPTLGLLGATVDDFESTRIAMENRHRQLLRNEPDADGLERGFGLSPEDPRVRSIQALINGLRVLENDAIKILEKRMKEHPLGPWVEKTPGVGKKQAARLLALIGDPYIHVKENRPRKVSELWAYCGVHTVSSGYGVPEEFRYSVEKGYFLDPQHSSEGQPLPPNAQDYRVAPVRQRGQRANWSTQARTRVYLIAESCLKIRQSPYRPIYDAARERYENAVHVTECRRCGPSGSPAPVGSPLSKGHQHGRGMRAMMQEILKDLWLEARRLHGGPETEVGIKAITRLPSEVSSL